MFLLEGIHLLFFIHQCSRLVSCLQSYGLPVSLSDKIFKKRTKKKCSVDEMVNIMKLDKKNIGPQKRMVLLSAIGKTLEPKARYDDCNMVTKSVMSLMILFDELYRLRFNLFHHWNLSLPNQKSNWMYQAQNRCQIEH